ncbi:HNH endonuclease [Aneurinibacillus tyrosinisolvens]|uniref:HNH endonuclease n=1 Tax=Aneurinibacillus tyrosinisolvens TaxID=1443435 RepID=UPI0006992C78|nr:HNH endonuclease [Aneurinibacillus tyrosinisolvens]
MEKQCLKCGKTIKVKPSHFERKRFCSRECKYDYYRESSTFNAHLSKKKEVCCNTCGKSFLKKQSVITERNFCSRECSNKYKSAYWEDLYGHIKKQVVVTCELCKKEFQVIQSRVKTAKYCSKDCLGKANGERAKVQLRKRIEVPCTNCGRPIFKKPSVVRDWNFCNQECMAEYYLESGLFAGANNGAWQGGDINYYGPNWNGQRRKARKRDNYTCQDCGVTEKEYEQELSVHHIVPFRMFKSYKEANELENLIILCEYPCHRKRHADKEYKSKYTLEK